VTAQVKAHIHLESEGQLRTRTHHHAIADDTPALYFLRAFAVVFRGETAL
jgi:hypothetical protein